MSDELLASPPEQTANPPPIPVDLSISRPGRIFARAASIVVIAIGGVCLLGWLLKSPALENIVPGSIPMRPNIAAGTLLCGVVLMFLSLGNLVKPLRLCVCVMALIGGTLGALSLAEYFFKWGVGIDQWLFRIPGGEGTPNAARTAPATALCFVLMGSALFVASRSGSTRLRVAFAAGLSAGPAAIGTLAMVGLLAESLLGHEWNLMGMSKSGVTASVAFLLLGSGLLGLLHSDCGLKWSLDGRTTTGFVFGVVVMVAVAAAAFTFARHMLETNIWVTHRQEVLKQIQQAMTELTKLASQERIYIIIGEEKLLNGRPETQAALAQSIASVRALTSDNPRQQHQLDQLQPVLAQQLAWEEKVILVRREQGFPVAQQLVSTGAGMRLSDEIGSRIHSMQDEEYGLLLTDRKRAKTVATATFLLLPLGVFLSLGILSLGVFFLNTGLTEQAETEQALRTSENEVRQLNAELEERVRQRTADLRAANSELEAFSYSVSHDLRAPLRAVDGFSQAVLEDYGPKLPDEGVHYLQTIRKGAQRMGALIDDLLSFSRLSRASLNKQSVDTTRLVRDVVAELNPEKEGRSVDLSVHDLLPCHGDPALLKQVWTNLLSNALKYTRKKEKAVIEVGSRSDNGENLYFVRDNGTGFDMRYAHKLFGVFQRLHRNDEFEGTGVGLAIVQRVVHRHGGRVWAESTPDHGATFHFSLKTESNS